MTDDNLRVLIEELGGKIQLLTERVSSFRIDLVTVTTDFRRRLDQVAEEAIRDKQDRIMIAAELKAHAARDEDEQHELALALKDIKAQLVDVFTWKNKIIGALAVIGALALYFGRDILNMLKVMVH
jgi:hypothetical protein